MMSANTIHTNDPNFQQEMEEEYRTLNEEIHRKIMDVKESEDCAGTASALSLNGFIALPYKGIGKHPGFNGWQKFKESPLDLFTEETKNMGILCGKVSDLTVVDIDNNGDTLSWWKKITEFFKFTKEPNVLTPSGGFHYYFDHERGLSNGTNCITLRSYSDGDKKLSIDVRNDKGQVVCPPSIYKASNPEKAKYDRTLYKWGSGTDRGRMPRWLSEALSGRIIESKEDGTFELRAPGQPPTKSSHIVVMTEDEAFALVGEDKGVIVKQEFLIEDKGQTDDEIIDQVQVKMEEMMPSSKVSRTHRNGDINTIEFRNTTEDECLICERQHKSNNNYCTFNHKTKKAYYKCHSCKDDGEEKAILLFAPKPEEKSDVYFEDYRKLASKPNLTVTEVESFLGTVLIRILNNGAPLWLSKNLNSKTELEYTMIPMPFKGRENCYFTVSNPKFDPNKKETKSNKATIRVSFGSILEEIQHLENKITCFNHMDFVPYIGKPPKLHSTYNLFTGFPHDKPADKFVINNDKVDKIIGHIKILTNHDNALFDYVMHWLAHLVQNPAEKSGVALLFKGRQGCGKNIFWDFMSKVIGAKHWKLVKKIDEFLGRFNKGMEGRLLTVLDEISNYGGAYRSNDYLKSMITDNTIRIEPKGLEAYEVSDFSRYVFLSNNEWAVKVEASDRRYVCIECSNEKVSNFDYFEDLSNAMDFEGASSFFNHLANMNLTGFNIRKIPTSKLKKEIKLMSVTKIVLYIIDRVESGEKDLCFADFVMWCEDSKERMTETARSFIKFFRDNMNIEPRRKTINFKKIRVIDVDVKLFTTKLRVYLKDDEFDFAICSKKEGSIDEHGIIST